MTAFVDDLRRYGSTAGISAGASLRLILKNPGIQALAMYRLGRFLVRKRWNALLWILEIPGWAIYLLGSRYVRICFGIRLHLDADLGPGLYIGHFGSILLTRCRLGMNCSISQSTRIEPNADEFLGPVLGDRVWVGAHAKIVGPVKLGDGCTVSAAAMVTRDIPEGALCLGSPARVILRAYDNSRILNLAPKSVSD